MFIESIFSQITSFLRPHDISNFNIVYRNQFTPVLSSITFTPNNIENIRELLDKRKINLKYCNTIRFKSTSTQHVFEMLICISIDIDDDRPPVQHYSEETYIADPRRNEICISRSQSLEVFVKNLWNVMAHVKIRSLKGFSFAIFFSLLDRLRRKGDEGLCDAKIHIDKIVLDLHCSAMSICGICSNIKGIRSICLSHLPPPSMNVLDSVELLAKNFALFDMSIDFLPVTCADWTRDSLQKLFYTTLLSQNLIVLNLSFCHLGNFGVEYLCSLLSKRKAALSNLTLSHNSLSDYICKYLFVVTIEQHKVTNLLDLSYNPGITNLSGDFLHSSIMVTRELGLDLIKSISFRGCSIDSFCGSNHILGIW